MAKMFNNIKVLKKLNNMALMSQKFFYRTKMSPSKPKLAFLSRRGVLEVNGKDSSKLLQGLITNDMAILTETNCKVLHTYVLSVQGRILYDLFIYKGQEESSFLIECDGKECDNLSHYLRRYKLRSKVYFHPREEFSICSLFNAMKNINIHQQKFPLDARNSIMGYRFLTELTDANESVKQLLKYDESIEIASEDDYTRHRYLSGISEGIEETLNGIPLEHNGAILNSISFQKGCYVGQELVARAHFTGVIRKRVMPLMFEHYEADIDITNTTVYNEKGKRAGKVLGLKGDIGIGLIRLKEISEDNHMFIESTDAKIQVFVKWPNWWPESIEN